MTTKVLNTMSTSTRINGIPLTLELNPIDTPFKQYLYEQVKKHNEEFEPCLFRVLPRLQDINEMCTFGVFSQTLMKSRVQYILASSSVNIDGALCTITQLSRYYLDFYHPNKLRSFGALTRATYELPQTPPLYIDPTIMMSGTYVDIKSAYFTTLINVGWDISYWQGVWLSPGRKPIDFPLKSSKPARSYLVTGSLKSSVGIWTGQKTYWRKTHNKHLNYQLWGYVTSMLHSIAQYAVSHCGACYVHTDGYIIPSENVAELIGYIKSWGLNAEVKAEGITYVCGFANFMCGEKRTKVFDPAKLQVKHDKIRWDIPALWLRDTTHRIININPADSIQD